MRWARRALTMVVLVGLLVGVPLALVRVAGAPWPHTVPDLPAAWSAIQDGRIEPDVVVRVLALVLWLAWVRLVVSLVVEVWHLARGRPTPGVRVLGASTQRLAALLVSGVSLLAATTGRIPAGAAAVPEALVRLLPSGLAEPEPLGSDSDQAANRLPTPPASRPTWSVRQHDSWWGLAERLYGDGTRWRELHQANLGREVAPGATVTAHTEYVEPGWTVVVTEIPTVEVVPGDTLSGIAEERLGDARAWPEIWEANRGEVIDGRRFEDPNLILPGWELELPVGAIVVSATPETTAEPAIAMPSPVAGAASVPADRTGPAATTLPIAPPSTSSAAGRPAGPIDATPGSVVRAAPPAGDACPTVPSEAGTQMLRGLGGAVLVATGAVALLGATRRRRWRSAPPHTRLPAPSPAAARAEAVVRLMDQSELVVRLDLALRAAAAGLVAQPDGSRPPARVQLAVVAPTGSIEVRFDTPVEPSAPWEPSGDRWWRLPPGVELEELAALGRSTAVPCPALVHVGRAPQGEVFVDVEAMGSLCLAGDPHDTQAILRGLALGLALSPFSLSAALIGVHGEADGWQAGRPWQLVGDAAEAVELAVACTSGLRERLGALGSTFAARASGALESWEPAIVVLPRGDVAAEHVNLIGQLTVSPAVGIALVTDLAEVSAGACLRHTEDGWVLEPFGLELVPVGLTRDEALAVHSMLDEAERAPAEVVAADAEPVPLPAWTLMVRVLGPLDVVDAAGRVAQFERSKAAELVAWLALHRERATRSAARTALWEVDVRDATFANVVSDARRSLARLAPPPPGEEWIGRTLTDQLPLHEAVVADVDVLRAHLARARLLNGAAAVDELRQGLSLVRDLVFSGTGFVWPDSSGLTSEVVLLVVSAATEMASRCLELGDVDGVFWATRQGLVVLPGHEELVGLRMQAYATTGDLAGVRSVWEEYLRSLAGDAWGETPSPKLVRLRQQLLSCTDRGSTPLSDG